MRRGACAAMTKDTNSVGVSPKNQLLNDNFSIYAHIYILIKVLLLLYLFDIYVT